MRKTLSLALMLLMVMHLLPAAFGAESVASQITAMPTGTHIELRLKSNQRMQGTRGGVSNSGFTLVDALTGEHQIAFDDVVSVKQLTKKSHLTRNILIGVGVGVAALGITAGILFRCGPFGCGSKGKI
jgi:hypothetical protein